jgi:hypothetical protein
MDTNPMANPRYVKMANYLKKMVDEYIGLSEGIGRDAVQKLTKKYSKSKPEDWPNGTVQQCMQELDALYCEYEPSREFGELLWQNLTVNNDAKERFRGNRLKFSGFLQEIVLGNITQQFINELDKGDRYLVLHDQMLLDGGNDRRHRSDLAIVRKAPPNLKENEELLNYYRENIILAIECKSNLNKTSIFEKFYRDTQRGSNPNYHACIIGREPDGNLEALFGAKKNSRGLKEIFWNKDSLDDVPKFNWLNATDRQIELLGLKEYDKETKIPVFFLPDGGGMYRLFNVNRIDDENDVDLLKRFNPNQAWFGISAFLHYVLSCLVWDDAFKKVNWKSFASTYEQ